MVSKALVIGSKSVNFVNTWHRMGEWAGNNKYGLILPAIDPYGVFGDIESIARGYRMGALRKSLAESNCQIHGDLIVEGGWTGSHNSPPRYLRHLGGHYMGQEMLGPPISVQELMEIPCIGWEKPEDQPEMIIYSPAAGGFDHQARSLFELKYSRSIHLGTPSETDFLKKVMTDVDVIILRVIDLGDERNIAALIHEGLRNVLKSVVTLDDDTSNQHIALLQKYFGGVVETTDANGNVTKTTLG